MKSILFSLFMVFIVSASSVQLHSELYPNGGEVLIANSDYTIRWSNDIFSKDDEIQISIWMYEQTVWQNIATVAPGVTSYGWRIPYIKGDKFRIKIQSKKNPSQSVMSVTFFSIVIGSNGGNPPPSTFDDVRFEITCFPNPTKNIVTCTWEGTNTIGISIYSIDGVRVLYQNISSTDKFIVNSTNWVNGTYTVEVIFDDDKRKVGKWIKLDS